MKINAYAGLLGFLLTLPPSVGTAQVSLTLDATVRRVIETHPAIRVSAERVRAVRGIRSTAGRWTNPTLTYEVENAALFGRASATGVERQVTAVATLPLEPGYQLGARVARANAEVRAAEADVRDTRRRLALEAVATFYRTALADVEVAGAREIRDWLDSLVVHARARVKEGAAAEVDLIRLEVEQGRAETDLALASVERARAAADLGALVGLDSVQISVSSRSETQEASRPLPTLDALLALARARRPDILVARARVSAAAAGARLERLSIVRELSVVAGTMHVSGAPAIVAGFNMSLPVFDQNRGEIQRASAERAMATYERQALERQVTAEVKGSYEAVRTISAQVVRIGTDVLRRAEEGRRIAEGAYREGATPLLQVLDAARALAETRRASFRTIFARRQSLIELNAAIGVDDLSLLTTMPGSDTSRDEQ